MMEIDTLLEERGGQYGEFIDNSDLSQAMKDTLRGFEGWNNLESWKREAFDMIVHKMARIINGDSDLVDSWDDISGYATLVSQRIGKDDNQS